MKLLNSNLALNAKFIDAKGPWLIDNKHNQFFDCWLGSGTLIFGHEPLNLGAHNTTLLPEGPENLEEIISLLTDACPFEPGGFGFQTSGSAAIHRACRIARAVTKKNKIAVFSQFWHGSDDSFLFSGPEKRQISSGIPLSSQAEMFWFNSIDDFLNASYEEFAALIFEPYQGSDPSAQTIKITKEIRSILKDKNVILIADEVITGFRSQYGVSLVSREIMPDIIVFGKVIAGGFPCGVVAFNKSIEEKLSQEDFFWGGTFAASPIQLNAIKLNLIRLKDLNYSMIKTNLIQLLEHLRYILTETNSEIKTNDGFARIYYQKPVTKEDLTPRGFSDKTNLNVPELLIKNKIFINRNGLIFPSIFNIRDCLK